MKSQDFAKLFVVEGIGQILVTLSETEYGDPCLTLRIPDAGDFGMSLDIAFENLSLSAAEARAREVFDAIDAEKAAAGVKPLIELRDQLLSNQDD